MDNIHNYKIKGFLKDKDTDNLLLVKYLHNSFVHKGDKEKNEEG
jgi:hypothetical protein